MRSNGIAPHPRVTVQGIERSFGSGDGIVRVLRGVDLRVAAGERVALYGPSGSGKTTLLNLIGALDRPNNGSICIDDQDILKMSDSKRSKLRRKQIGFIFQSYTLMPTYSAYENVDLALRLPGIGFFERRKRAAAAIAAVGLTAWADHVPDELSGGQRQRVAIARALALQPKLILADEPTSGLDSRTARRILGLFEAVAHAQGTTFLIVSHDPMVANYVDVAYDLFDGRLLPHASHKEELT
jgi:putative ABC transport system ATP-binding protein